MSESAVQDWTGIFRIGVVVFNLIVIPLYFVYSGPLPPRNTLVRVFLSMLGLTALIAFLTGFRHSLLRAGPEYEWLATLCLALGLVHTGLTFVADSLQAGSVLGKIERIDPTLLGSGGEKTMVLYGPMSRLLETAFLAAAGSAILATRILPAWTAWLAYAVGVVQLAFVPTLFSGTDPSRFYSINGWGIPVAGGLFLVWILAVSIACIVAG